VSLPGSCDAAAERVCGVALGQGLTPMEAQYLAAVARRGGTNWQTNAQLQALMQRPGGGHYHVESIGRTDRNLRRKGFIESTRVFAGQKIPAPGAKYFSAHGTTVKRIIWASLRLKNPLTRRERAAARAQQRTADRAHQMVAPPTRASADPAIAAGPRFSAPAPSSSPAAPASIDAQLRDSFGNLPADLPPKLRETFERIEAHRSRRERAGPD
jgi:hypothetical protein